MAATCFSLATFSASFDAASLTRLLLFVWLFGVWLLHGAEVELAEEAAVVLSDEELIDELMELVDEEDACLVIVDDF